MYVALISIFIITALLGAFLLSYVITDKNTPKGVAIVHGLFAFASIVCLAIYAWQYRSGLAALILFILAALGGGFMFSRDILGKDIPKGLALGHGVLAIIALVVLVIFGRPS